MIEISIPRNHYFIIGRVTEVRVNFVGYVEPNERCRCEISWRRLAKLDMKRIPRIAATKREFLADGFHAHPYGQTLLKLPQALCLNLIRRGCIDLTLVELC